VTGLDPGHALILSGGGAQGAYEVGVMQALFSGESPSTARTPVVPGIVTGTSVGGFNAAALMSFDTGDLRAAADALADVWLETFADAGDGCGSGVFRYRADPLALLGRCGSPDRRPRVGTLIEEAASLAVDFADRGATLLRSSTDLSARPLELIDLETLLSFEPFEHVIRSRLQFDRLRHSARAFRMPATNWRTGQVRIFANADMTDEWGPAAVLASAAIPGVCHSVEIEGQPYVDGGLVMNTPLKPAIDSGAEVLHVVYMNPDVSAIGLPRMRNTVNTFFRSMVIGFGEVMNQDIRQAARMNRWIGRIGLPSAAASLEVPHLDPSEEGAPYRPLTIHRYHPAADLGGAFRWLSFEREYLSMLVERGRTETIEHDCKTNHCVLPEDSDTTTD